MKNLHAVELYVRVLHECHRHRVRSDFAERGMRTSLATRPESPSPEISKRKRHRMKSPKIPPNIERERERERERDSLNPLSRRL